MLLRVVRLGLAGLLLLYGMFVAGMVAAQRMFVFDVRDTGGHLDEPGTLAIEGSTRVTIATKDGEKLAGWYLPPREKGAITFLFFHGKGGGLERKKERWKKIAEHGAGVLAFSYRGFPGSTGTPSEAGLYQDARAAFEWLSKHQYPDKIVLHGLSLGTGVAAKLASEVKARALILEAPFTALADVAGDRHPYLPVSLLLWDRFATRDIISDAKMPVLIAHGDSDKAIPIAHAEELFELAPEPKAFVTIPGGGHETLVKDGLYQHIWRFIGDLPEA